MKRLLILVFALLPSLSFGLTLQQLTEANVTHLQLMVNNLNILMLSKQVADEKQPQGFEKFTLTNTNRLVLTIFSTVPAAELTRANCMELVNERVQFYKENSDTFFTLMGMASMYNLDHAETKKLLDSLFGDASLVADINSELIMRCNNAK
ncbi:hypothetical protein P886_2015 [Alteromonadaceae bacterium 2753L.S.0a.02]|nr:hypothetical protein P886_2015 [Alteromonadaceae bacterium 2753L.S.0a.02]